jgi:hypothetical protein
MKEKILRLSSTLGNGIEKCAAIQGTGKLESSEIQIWDRNQPIYLKGKEISDLFFLLKKGFDRGILDEKPS